MATIFSRIIAGEIPSYKVAEDDRYFAFLDINPLVKGHTLVVPKVETDYVFDLEDDTLAGLMVFAKKIALAMDETFDCARIAVSIIGLEVPHAHVHLLPMKTISDTNFTRGKLSFSSEEMSEMAADIAKRVKL